MASIGVLHSNLSTYGGGEVVCMHVLKSLERDHDVDLITATPEVDIDSLAAFAGVAEPCVTVRPAHSVLSLIHQLRGDWLGLAESAVFNRVVRPLCDDYDLVVSTMNELALPDSAVQYIHVPHFDRSSVPGELGASTIIYRGYKRACRAIAGWSKAGIANSTLLTNSDWTSDITQDIYDVQPRTVYPPVDVDAFSPKPWTDRENGFVSVGRIEVQKKLLELIQIVDSIQDRGFDFHYHIVGDHNGTEYWQRVSNAIEQRPYISYEGAIERNQLIELLENHKFGLHGRRYEHFGMAVAEMVTAGMVPFIPDSGGQVEIVGGEDRVTFSSPREAIEKIDRILSGSIDPTELRTSFQDPATAFSVTRFQNTISSIVEEQYS